MYVKDDIKCTQIALASANAMECIAVTITLSLQMSFNVIGVYIDLPHLTLPFMNISKTCLKN